MAILFSFLAFLSCSRLPNVQGEGHPLFQGIWIQEMNLDSAKRISYAKHELKFTCDSFYLSLVTYSKANYYPEECFNDGVWKEYAKGTYTFKNDTLSLSGVFTKANFKQKISGCYRNGRYFNQFIVKKNAEKELSFQGIQDKSQFVLNQKEEIICSPKPL
ncbi:MAG: fumarate hydratase [Pedobacter sp.]|nr:MAG: fumarate hydratase [Pedobacter sp.]